MPPPPDWHIIKLDSQELAFADDLAAVGQFVLTQPHAPLLLVSSNSEQLDGLRTRLRSILDREGATVHEVVLSTLIVWDTLTGVDWPSSQQRVLDFMDALPPGHMPVVFDDREMGDFAASLLCNLFGALQLTLLGDAEGIPTAPLGYVEDAYILRHLSFQEAAELAYPNGGLLHPRTLIPLAHLDLTIQIQPLQVLSRPGTTITSKGPPSTQLAKAVTAQAGLSLLVLEGLGLAGVPGITARVLATLASQQINVVLLSQAATEQSVGIVIAQEDRSEALAYLKQQFDAELDSGEVSRIYALDSVGLVTIVDDNMRYRPGLTGKMFSTLGRSGINVLTLAEGASETNISAVVAGEDVQAAVAALHEAFCHGRRRAHVFMFGAGTIGRQLLHLMTVQTPHWIQDLNLKISLVGLSNSRQMVWDKAGIPYEKAIGALRETAQPLDLNAIVDHLINSRLDRLIVIDATASNEIAALYPALLEHNIAIVTPNKLTNTKSFAFYNKLRMASRDHQVPYFYETTVGAGLPIISTLRDLIRSGDEIIRVEGVLSGTLSYIFNSMKKGHTFANALKQAYEKGFTEPDPREDLFGEDVARKMLILAREMGHSPEREAIQLTPLLPDRLRHVTRESFLENLDDLLTGWSPGIAYSADQILHFVGTIEQGSIKIGMQALAADSPFVALQGTDNMIIFTTRRYFDNPLVIKGPGAGPAVTAGGVLADLIRAAELVT